MVLALQEMTSKEGKGAVRSARNVSLMDDAVYPLLSLFEKMGLQERRRSEDMLCKKYDRLWPFGQAV